MRQGNRARLVGVLGWLAAVALVGCGSTASSGPQASAGTPPGSGGNGAATAGAAGTNVSGGGASSGGGGANANAGGANAGAGGLVLGDSKTEACIGYVLAACGRQDQCSGVTGGANCLKVSFSCPDLVFSPGATRTVADLKACVDAYQKLPCDQIELGVLPACVTPGTLALGEPCSFSSQCSSLSCDSRDSCGTCVPSAHEGEPCGNGPICLGQLSCNGEKCERLGGTPAAEGKNVGEDCAPANAVYCKADLRCDTQTSKCVAFPTLGMSCADALTCGGGSYCELDGLVCKAMPGEGMPCGVSGVTGRAGACAEPLRCARTSKGVGTCGKLPQVGQPCLIDPETSAPESVACEPAARCDASQVPPKCSSKVAKGGACMLDADCASGTACICPGAQSACDAKICASIQLKGQPCTATGDVCHPGLSCTAGVCEPRESQGLFAAECAP